MTGNHLVVSKEINETLHVILLGTSLICIPLMLCVKPIYLKLTTEVKHKPVMKKSQSYHQFEDEMHDSPRGLVREDALKEERSDDDKTDNKFKQEEEKSNKSSPNRRTIEND